MIQRKKDRWTGNEAKKYVYHHLHCSFCYNTFWMPLYVGQTSHLEWKLWGNWDNQFVIYRWCHYVEKTWIGKVGKTGERSVIKGDKRECKIWSSVPWTGGIIIKPNLALFNGIWNKLQLRGVIYVIGILYSWGKGRGIGGVGITAEGESYWKWEWVNWIERSDCIGYNIERELSWMMWSGEMAFRLIILCTMGPTKYRTNWWG